QTQKKAAQAPLFSYHAWLGSAGLGNCLLRYSLLGRRLGGSLLGDRRSCAHGHLAHRMRTRIAIAGVVTLALGGLTVTLTHVVNSLSLKSDCPVLTRVWR